jgi:hypothetical protein
MEELVTLCESMPGQNNHDKGHGGCGQWHGIMWNRGTISSKWWWHLNWGQLSTGNMLTFVQWCKVHKASINIIVDECLRNTWRIQQVHGWVISTPS